MLLAMLFVAGQAWSQSTRIYADGFSISPGESTEWEIMFDGDVYITSAVVVVDIPEGFEFENKGTARRPVYATTSDVSSGLTIASNLVNDGAQLRLVMTDNQQIGTDETSGVLVKVNIKAKEDVALNDYTFKLSELSASDENESNYQTDDQEVTVTVFKKCLITVGVNNSAYGSTAISPEGKDKYDSGTSVTVTATANDGYHFVNWTVGETEVSTDAAYTFTVTDDLSIVANFAPNQYTITFDTDGGTPVDDLTADYNSTLTKPEDPTKTGYDFAGWSPEFPETMPLNGASLKALWTPVVYAVSYDLAGGTLAEGETNPVEYTIESEDITLANPTREGYTFAGWTGTDLTEAAQTVTIAKGSTGNRSYTATWTINQYTMTFVLDNGEENVVKTQDYGTELTAPADLQKTGFTFKGWSPEVPATVPAEDKTFTAQWERNKYNLTWVVDGEESTTEVLYEDPITKPEDPTKEGYTFTGWTPEVAETMPAGDVTYTAQFQINQYTITFDTDGGSAIDDITADYQSALTKPEDPTKTGYDFAGWSPEFPETMPLNGTSLKALWTPIVYAISYDLAGGTMEEDVTNPVSYTIESEGITLANPTREGYTFAGWTGTDLTEATLEVTIAKGSIGNRSYTATWTVATAIETMSVDSKQVDVFDLRGRKVRSNIPVSMLNKELPRGIYIIGGKKVAITK